MPATHFADLACPLVFVRHGATAPNLAGLRCGGDLDVPLTDLGRRQAAEAAQRLRALAIPIGVVIASDLLRTRETAEIIAAELGGVLVCIAPAFAERRLGDWNLRPIEDTEDWLAQGRTPEGGESNALFCERITAAAARTLLPLRDRSPLLVGSKGVARILRALLGLPPRHSLANAEIVHFDLAPLARRSAQRCPA